MEAEVVRLLKKKGLKICFVESCTGGLLAATLINVSGASAVIEQSYVTYSNEAKHKLAGVKNKTLKERGAVSKKTAKEMAKGGAKAAECPVCVSVTGVAGPGTEEGKPVGLVYIGVYFQGSVTAYKFRFDGTRSEIRKKAVDKALSLIVKTIA